jgi:hypothetical protein
MMTRKVRRDEVLDWQTYSDQREQRRNDILPIKNARRVHLGDELTFLFENTATMLYQIQEMVRAERIVKEASIQHEIDTYNNLLGGTGELSCSLLIEIEDVAERRRKLTEWLALPAHVYLRMEDGSRVAASYDASQVGEDRLSAVQYLKFDTGGQVPVAVGCDMPGLMIEQELSVEQRAALREDLGKSH